MKLVLSNSLICCQYSLIMKCCNPVVIFIAYKCFKLQEIFGKTKIDKIFTIALHVVLHDKAFSIHKRKKGMLRSSVRRLELYNIQYFTTISKISFHKCLKYLLVSFSIYEHLFFNLYLKQSSQIEQFK